MHGDAAIFAWKVGKMTSDWLPLETNTHQDHVIAHVIDATVLGYFSLDETMYVLLDIGFVWKIYLDGEMGLLPQALAIRELEVEESTRQTIQAETDDLTNEKIARDFQYFIPGSRECRITEVTLFTSGDQRRLVVSGEGASLAIETSLTTGEVNVYEFR